MAYHPFRNLGLKTLAVAAATLLWLSVSSDPLVERSLRVPLEFQNVPANLEIVGDVPATVDVRVRGTARQVGAIEPGQGVAVLDLKGARSGARLFNLLNDDVRLPFGVQVVQVNPSTVSLSIERTGAKRVPVVPVVTGEPPEGYSRGPATVDPAEVEVVGPESRLLKLAAATTDSVSIADQRQTVRDRVTVGVNDPTLRLRTPVTAVVTVEVVQATIERSIEGVPLRFANLGAGHRAVALPPRVAVVVRGGRDMLADLDAEGIEVTVDCAGLSPGRYTLPVRFATPDRFTIVSTDPARVTVRVR